MIELTKSQLEAINSKARFLAITAGAGSGKTRVLVERVVRLVESKEATLDEILAITFTEKAALELKQRLTKAVNDEISISTAAIGTFHSFCARIIRDDAPLLGIDPDFGVLEEQTAGLLLRKAVKETLLNMLKENSRVAWVMIEELDFKDSVELLEELIGYRWHAQKIVRACHPERSEGSSAFNCASLDSSSLDKLETQNDRREQELFTAAMECFDKANKRYAELKGPNLDFADLEIFAIRLLEQKDVRNRYQRRFRYIFVDEFQDVNDTQSYLISLLFNIEVNHLTVVGDEKQSIYRFRGANVGEFKKALELAEHTVTLKENFRSTVGIIEYVNSIFPEFMPLIPSTLCGGGSPAIRAGTHHYCSGGQAEPRPYKGCDVELKELIDNENALSDERRANEATYLAGVLPTLEGSTACLFSSLKSSDIYMKAFEEKGLPYTIIGGSAFLEKEEIIDMLNALKVTLDKNDIMALLGLARSPYIGLTDEELFILCRYGKGGAELYQKIREHPKGGFLNVIEGLRGSLSISELIRTYVGEPLCGLPRAVTEDRPYEVRKQMTDDLEKLCHMADDAGTREKISLKDFVEYLNDLKKKDAGIPEFPQGSNDNVSLMTIHQAKGLEFDNVVLCDTIRQNKKDSRKWCFIRGEKGGLAFKLRPEENPEGDPIETENYTRLSEQNEKESDKERERLLYVAMTRAKKRLVIPLHPGAKKDGAWHRLLLEHVIPE